MLHNFPFFANKQSRGIGGPIRKIESGIEFWPEKKMTRTSARFENLNPNQGSLTLIEKLEEKKEGP